MSTRTRAKRSPLVNALIAEIPAAGTPWPPDQRAAWLDMMGRAFDIAWGNSAPPPPAPAAPTRLVAKPPFYIDAHGAARNRKGKAIMPGEVEGNLVDLRGMDGNPATIIWADGTVGLAEAGDLTITAG